ncbi:MAG: small subunit ribosomal protein S9 [Candidatus Marinamargulisbacteria bacterium]|jgi:small subunit ribosomal protein S9
MVKEKVTEKETGKPKAGAATASKATPSKTKSKRAKDGRMVIPNDAFYGTGKRKNAIARVWIFKGSGKVEVNNKTMEAFFCSNVLIEKLLKPFEKLELAGKFDVVAKTSGGGITGQADATRLGISRALLTMDEEHRKNLKESGFLTRDPRVKERKKYGRKRARKGYQFRKR